jgi:hypothetical protein
MNRMNASDIIKAKQNRTLFQAYYRPTIFPGTTPSGQSTLITSTINYCPYSSISSGGLILSSFTSSVNFQYLYTCNKPLISYELENSINSGKYTCGYPYCSSLSIWSAGGTTVPIGTCNCKISNLQWKNTTQETIYNYAYSTGSTSVIVTSTVVASGPGPIICPQVEFYQGTNFDSRCNTCNMIGNGINVACYNCSSGQ